MTRRRPRPPTATWAAWAACTKPGKPSLRYQKEGSGRIPLFLSSGFLTVDETAGKIRRDLPPLEALSLAPGQKFGRSREKDALRTPVLAWKAMTRGKGSIGPWETSRLHQLRGADRGNLQPAQPDLWRRELRTRRGADPLRRGSGTRPALSVFGGVCGAEKRVLTRKVAEFGLDTLPRSGSTR